MSEIAKTTIFAAAAVFAAGAAFATYKLTEPAPVAGFEKVGGEFWPKFKDPNLATALRVAAVNEKSGQPQTFTVELKDGKWRIPSHHNYPAEAKQHLADVSASVLGIEREALASRWKSDPERFGVVDPLDDSAPASGRGKRITLYQDKGDDRGVLADYIIGSEVEDRDGYYYIRRPDENETYFAQADVKLTTKFSDWIEPDLLRLQQDDLRKLEVSRPDIGPGGRVTGLQKTELARNDATDPWKLAGISDSEEVKIDRAREVTRALDDLKIVGVRPKPAGLTPQLRLDAGVSQDPRMESLLIQELEEKGYYVRQDAEGNRIVISREGELITSTHDGIVYHLHFGDVFSGSVDEIEFGGTDAKKDSGTSADKTAEIEADSETSGDGGQPAGDEQDTTETDGAQKSDGLQLSRYLFVRVEFDESAVTGKPTEPVKPDIDENAPIEAPKPGDPPPKDPLADYEREMDRYKTDLEQFEKKIEDARRKVDELNDRFGEWYYVVSDDSFKKLRFTREDIVQPRKAEAKADSADKPTGSQPPENAEPQPGDAASQPADETESQPPDNAPAADEIADPASAAVDPAQDDGTPETAAAAGEPADPAVPDQ